MEGKVERESEKLILGENFEHLNPGTLRGFNFMSQAILFIVNNS